MYDQVGGNAPQVFEIGTQTANQLGSKHKSLYFQAKKEYFNKEYQNSYNLIKQSVSLDPTYERAVKLKELYDNSAGVQ